ncbi:MULTISPECIES: HEAT repeat domain-containing protein [unclassified Moorena]|uniref:HEAT repeat domain-containing protein n=1 Tax=unclassified Moorena TaxID=2683338 RepID=UPI0013C7599D|nr:MULTISPECIES: HEAT repeat domain-containing protein [unclassified Moorena]NEO20465.1 HEAT repeat domain-containing protein [Moorena sp. SIO4A5]NEQ57024.1 HEAT repeat domain-containing protein [Moorena sp. SIO4A1]
MTNTTQGQELIRAVKEADSAYSLVKAVKALANARLEAGIPTLIAVLSYNNPGAAGVAAGGLVGLGKTAVAQLLNLIDDYNYGGRAWAIRALAAIGDPRALDTLIEAAESDFAMSVRRAATKGLGNLDWEDMPKDKIPAAQEQAFKTLLLTCQDTEWVVRYSSVVGLQGLATAVVVTYPDLAETIKTHLAQMFKTETDVTVGTRIQLAIQQLA